MARSQSRGRDYSSGGGASRSSQSRSRSSSRSPDRSRRRSRSLSPRRDDHRGGGRVGGGGRDRSAEPRGSVGKRDGSRGRRNDSRDDRRGVDYVPGWGERGRGVDKSRRDRSRDRGRSRSIEQDHRRDGGGGGYRYRKTDKDRSRSSSSRKESARVESRDRSGFGDRERDRGIGDRDRDRSFRVDSRDRSHSRSRNKKRSSDGGKSSASGSGIGSGGRGRDGERARERERQRSASEDSRRGEGGSIRGGGIRLSESRSRGGGSRSQSRSQSMLPGEKNSSDDGGRCGGSGESFDPSISSAAGAAEGAKYPSNISRSAKKNTKSDRPKPSIALSGGRPPRPPPPTTKDARAHVAKPKLVEAEAENATADSGSGTAALKRSRPSALNPKSSSVERRANEDSSLSSGGSGSVTSGNMSGKSTPPSSRQSGGVTVASLGSREKSLPPSSRHSGSPSTTTSPLAATAPLSATAMISPKKQPSDPDSKAEASRKSSSTSARSSTTHQARRAPRKAAVVAAVKIKSTSEAGGGISGVNETGDGPNPSSYGAGDPAPDDSEEEATLDLEVPSVGALTPNSQNQASAVSTPKPIGPHEWVMAKLKVDEMITDDKFQVFTNPPRNSIGRGKKYDAYLAMVSEPYWLSRIQKQISKTKPGCRYETVDDFLHDVRRLCANSFVFTRSTSNDLLKKFLRKLEAKEVKNVLTPSRPLVPKWQQCLALLDKLYSCGDSIYFMAYPFKVYFLSQPEEEFPDYAEKVKQPMDMAKVVIKLLTGRYKDEGGMVADLRLMIDNCRRYYTGNPNHEEKTIQLALSNAKIVEDALQAGLELLLPDWQATAAPPQPGNRIRPKSVTPLPKSVSPPPKADRRASLPSGTASASRLSKSASSQSGGNSSGNKSNATTVAAASAALVAASSHTLVAGINAKTKQSGSMLGAGSKVKGGARSKLTADSGDTRRTLPPLSAAAPSPAAAVGGSLQGTTSSKSTSRPSKKVGGGGRKSPGKPGSNAGSGSGVLGAGGAAAGVGVAGATMGEAAKLPAEITGAAATVGAGISRPGASLGVAGSRSGDGGGVPERNTWSGSNVAEAAKELPLSETQAKSMGLVAIGSDGKARAKKLVRDLKARCNKAIKRLQEPTLPPKLAQLSLKIFDVPVDETKVTDYSQIVSHKMDVDTVKTKIKNSRYPHVAAFFSDLLLVYENAVNYYEKDGKLRDKLIYEAAKALHTLASRERTAMVREFVPQVTALRATVSSSASRPASESAGSPTPLNNVGIATSTSPSPSPSPSLSAFSSFSAQGSRPQASAGIGAKGVGASAVGASAVGASAVGASAVGASAVGASGRVGVYGVKGKKSSAGRTSTPEKPPSKSPVLPAGKTRPAEDSSQEPPKKPRQGFTIPKKPEEIARLKAKKRAAEEQRVKAQKERAERAAKAREDADRKAAEEERMRLDKLRREKEAAEEAARKAREEALQKAKKKAARKAKEEAARKAKGEAARKAKEEAARKAKEEAARKAKEEASLRKAKEESLRKAREEAAAQKAREEAAAQKAKEEAAAQKAKEEAAEQKAREEAAAQKAREEAAARKAKKEKAAQKAKEERAARKAEEKAARKAREEAVRKAKEEKVARKAAAAARKAEETARKTEARKRRQAEVRATVRAAAAKTRTVMRLPTDIPAVTNAALESPGAQGLLDIFNGLTPLDDIDWKCIAPRLSLKVKACTKKKGASPRKVKGAPPKKRKRASGKLDGLADSTDATKFASKDPAPSKSKAQLGTPSGAFAALPGKGTTAEDRMTGVPSSKKRKTSAKAGKGSNAGGGDGGGGSDAVIWSAASKSRPVSQFRSSTGAAAAGASGAKKASSVSTKRPAITLPEPRAVELPEVESPEAGEVVLGKMAGGKASKGKKKAAGSKPKKGGGHKATSQSQECGAKDSTIRAKPPRVNDSADKPRLTLKFNAQLVRSVSAKSMPTPPVASSSSNPLLRLPSATTAPAASISSATWPAVKPKTSSKPAPKSATTTTRGSSKSTTLKPGSKSTVRSTSKSGSKSTGKSAPKTVEPSLPPFPPPALSLSRAPPRQSGKGVGRGKGKRGNISKGNSPKTPPEYEAPVVVMPAGEKPLAPDGWGPETTQKQDSPWQKAAITVLNRLKRRETLLNEEFLSKFPELDVNLTKEFSLPPAEMAKYRALVGEPMVLSTVEHNVRSTHLFKCPQHFVNEGLQIFTNGIVWWGQDPFKGDQFAGDVVRICKHLRSVFRWHCLETLPLWVWSGKDGKDPPPPDPAPSTEEEWEAEHLRPCPLTPAEQKRARLLREENVSSMKMTEGRSLAAYVLRQMKKKDTKAMFWTEVDLTLCPDYLEVCPQLMDLGTVERKLGRPDDSNREYLYHSEFIRDMRLIYANSIAYNNPDTVINELDRDTTVRYNTIAKNHAAELEKLLGSPYTINVLEELGRMEIVKMILDRREELRKIQFEEAARKNREANREAELLRAEEEEAEEDRDPVERDEMARQDSKKRRAVVKEKKMLKKLEEVERDNMCEAMRFMSEVHKSSIAAAMAETRSYGKRKEEWERKMMELEAAESAPQSVASKSRGSREHTSDSHWGTFAVGSFSPDTSCEKEAVTSFGTAETAQSEPVVKEVRGSWAVLSSVEEPFGAGVDSHIGNGGSGIGSGSRDTCILGKSKKPSSLGGVKFALKGKARPGQKGRARPKVAGTMAKAADVADAEEEAVEAAKAAVDAGEVLDSGGKKASAPEDAMRAAPAGIIDAAGELAKGVFSGSSRPDGEGTRSKAVVFTHAPGVGSAPAVQSASVTVTNPVSRVQLAVSKPLLADDGTVAGRNLERAICLRRDARLGRMSWKGGLCMIRAIIKDARGGQRLRNIGLTHNPSGLKIKVLGTKITVASPPDMIFKDGFYEGRSDDLVNGLRHLRNNLQKLDIHLEQYARGGQESLMRVENLKEKRLALSQVGEIMDEQEFQFIPALGGAWLGVSHTPKLKANSSVWWEGSKTPFVSIQLLVRRARLSSVRVEEDAAYAEMAAAASAAEMAAAASAAEMAAAASAAEMAAAASAAEAAAEVETIAGEGNKPSRSSVWGVEETRQATRLFESMLRAPTARMFSFLDD